MQGTSYELKYCERCGSLGLRRSKSAETDCRSCGQRFDDCLSAQTVRRLRRKPETPVPSLPAIQDGVVAASASARRTQ